MIIVRNGVFYVGQKVLIRQWEDMAQEFGTDEDGIPCEGIWFIKTMKRDCGALAEIVGFTEDEVMLSGPVGMYHYNCHMIEPFDKEPDEDFITGIACLLG